MVESLQELNKIVQKPDYKTQGNWMVRHILRDAALPITWLLLHTPVTANQVTLGSLAVGLLGVCLLAFPGAGFFLTACLLLQLWYLLDHVDGQIARYRGASGITGRFFDFMTHHLMHGVLFFSLGYHGYERTGRFFFMVWGFLASGSITLFNLIQDAKYKTFYEKLSTLETVRIKAGEETKSQSKAPGDPRLLRTGFSWLHKMCEIHVLMNILTMAAILETLFNASWDLRFLLFIFYGILIPFITVVKLGYIISNRKIDQEFHSLFCD